MLVWRMLSTGPYCCCRFEVPDVHDACKRFESLGIRFVKKPDEGKMKDIAFIQVQFTCKAVAEKL